jgi:hypothetical protein
MDSRKECNCFPDMQVVGCRDPYCMHNPDHKCNDEGIVNILGGKPFYFSNRKDLEKWRKGLPPNSYPEAGGCCCSICGNIVPPSLDKQQDGNDFIAGVMANLPSEYSWQKHQWKSKSNLKTTINKLVTLKDLSKKELILLIELIKDHLGN